MDTKKTLTQIVTQARDGTCKEKAMSYWKLLKLKDVNLISKNENKMPKSYCNKFVLIGWMWQGHFINLPFTKLRLAQGLDNSSEYKMYWTAPKVQEELHQILQNVT